jgi:hypothetical protein
MSSMYVHGIHPLQELSIASKKVLCRSMYQLYWYTVQVVGCILLRDSCDAASLSRHVMTPGPAAGWCERAVQPGASGGAQGGGQGD